MEFSILEKACSFCSLLKETSVRDELMECLKGYKLDEGFKNNDEFALYFSYEGNEKIILKLSPNYINLNKISNKVKEEIIINNSSLSHQIVEKKENGIVVTNIKKKFRTLNKFSDKLVLTNLSERRSFYKRDSIEKYFEGLDYESSKFILDVISIFESKGNFKDICEFQTIFKTYLNITSSVKTYVDDKDVSNFFFGVNGNNKLARIYDLYRGVISAYNAIDIRSIHLGIIKTSAFDLKSLLGITEKEESIIGKSIKDYSYAQELLSKEYGYEGEVVDRNSILNAIVKEPENTPKKFVKKIPRIFK